MYGCDVYGASLYYSQQNMWFSLFRRVERNAIEQENCWANCSVNFCSTLNACIRPSLQLVDIEKKIKIRNEKIY